MRKKELSDDKLAQVRELHQAGYSWLAIEQKTGVKRRLAKRAYNEWLDGRSLNELRQARVNVATEALREHVDSLVKFAERLTDHLDLPRYSGDLNNSANEHLSILFDTNILGEFYELSQVDIKGKSQRNRRRNQKLFKSLRDHTVGKVRWQALDEWEKAWDICRSISNMLRPEAEEVVAAVLDEENDILERIKKQTVEEESAVKWMARTVLDAIWQSILDGKFNPECPEVAIAYRFVERQLPYTLISKEMPSFTLKEWNEGLTNACQNVAKILLKDQRLCLVKQLYDEVRTVTKAIEELDEMLDSLVLRRLILLRQCDLCPA